MNVLKVIGNFIVNYYPVIIGVLTPILSALAVKKSKLKANDIPELIANIFKSLAGVFKKV